MSQVNNTNNQVSNVPSLNGATLGFGPSAATAELTSVLYALAAFYSKQQSTFMEMANKTVEAQKDAAMAGAKAAVQGSYMDAMNQYCQAGEALGSALATAGGALAGKLFADNPREEALKSVDDDLKPLQEYKNRINGTGINDPDIVLGQKNPVDDFEIRQKNLENGIFKLPTENSENVQANNKVIESLRASKTPADQDSLMNIQKQLDKKIAVLNKRKASIEADSQNDKQKYQQIGSAVGQTFSTASRAGGGVFNAKSGEWKASEQIAQFSGRLTGDVSNSSRKTADDNYAKIAAEIQGIEAAIRAVQSA